MLRCNKSLKRGFLFVWLLRDRLAGEEEQLEDLKNMDKRPKTLAFSALMSVCYSFVFPQYSWTSILSAESIKSALDMPAQVEQYQVEPADLDSLAVVEGHALVQTSCPDLPKVAQTRYVLTTAYSSTPDQTDDTPFITANGSNVRDGIIACNFLRFGTRVKFPNLYGDKIFVVEDRMALRNSHKMDIWFETREQALQFGARTVKVEILQN